MKNIQHSLLTGLMLYACVALGQNTISASGGDAKGNGGTAAYSLGQVVYNTYSSDAFSLSQGVQQAYKVFTLGVSSPKLKGTLTAYPNPTTHKLTLDIKEIEGQDWSYTLVDLQGRLILTGAITSTQTSINMSTCISATYLLTVKDENQTRLQTFKIIKQ